MEKYSYQVSQAVYINLSIIINMVHVFIVYFTNVRCQLLTFRPKSVNTFFTLSVLHVPMKAMEEFQPLKKLILWGVQSFCISIFGVEPNGPCCMYMYLYV